jgi:type I restriction enzyme M protein
MHFTLKTDPLERADLDEFVALFNPVNRHERRATWGEDAPDGRWRAFGLAELVNRDKASLDIFWLKDDSLADWDNLPPPEVIAQEIVADLEAALEQFREIAADLGPGEAEG